MIDRHEAFKKIIDEVSDGEIVFSTGTQAALNIYRILGDPDMPVERVAKLLQGEPLLAARVVAVANSVTYNRSGRAITNIRSAVNSLGFATVRTLAKALAVRQVAGVSQHPTHQKNAAQLWRHTTHVAALASVIARRVTHQNPDSALFAGIVHEVGTFYLIGRLGEYPELLFGDDEVWVEEYESQLGRAVLQALSVPDPIVQGIEVMWQGYLAFPPVSFGDTLLLADQLAPVESPLHRSANGNDLGLQRAEIEAMIGGEALTSILAESQNEVDSLSAALL